MWGLRRRSLLRRLRYLMNDDALKPIEVGVNFSPIAASHTIDSYDEPVQAVGKHRSVTRITE
jgi:hypothetical protein